MRLAFVSVGVVALATLAPAARAQEECPPGGWFCEGSDEPATDDPEGEPTDVLQPEAPGGIEIPARAAGGRPPPIVVYYPSDQPPPAIVVDTTKTRPKAPRQRRKREWGFNLHLEGVMMGGRHHDGGPDDDSGMAGLGFSLRYRPVPAFALDTGLDFLAGVDWEGNDRAETAFLLNGMVFFNPRDKFQIYMLAGLGFSGASVRVEESDGAGGPAAGATSAHVETVERYSYFGGQLGLGFEWRVAKKTALQLDVVGFVRGRTDDAARFEPEFVDPDTGRTTNSSGGGLVRGGVTFYW